MKNSLKNILALLLLCIGWSTAQADVVFDESKQYSIKNVKCGLYVTLNPSAKESGTDNVTPLKSEPGYFTIKKSSTSGKFAISQGSNYIGISTTIGWNTAVKTTTTYAWEIAETETPGVYTLHCTKGFLKYDGKNKFAYVDGKEGQDITWMIEEQVPYASELESGTYYRLKNQLYPDRLLTEVYTDGNVLTGYTAAEVKTPYTQIWKLTKTADLDYTEGKWKLTNVMTGRSIASQSTQSAQFKTTTSGTSFVVQKGTAADGQTYFTFGLAKDGNGLHCEAGHKIVNWSVSAGASQWFLQPVEMTDEILAEIAEEYKAYTDAAAAVKDVNSKRATYNATLEKVFTDLSCSELTEEYAAMSEDELVAALASLPEPVQQMALCVKRGTWDATKDETYNGYVRDFRINTYEPYSDRHTWKAITNVGPFGQHVNPTGITVKAGEIVYVYLDQSAKDSYASIKLELAKGTEHEGTTVDLKKGINAWHATDDGELFISYFVKNDKKYVVATADHEADYPNIRVHIEGGHATGTWDMHRGMDNDDWDYLCKNMFDAEFLHVKGESTVLALVTSKVKGAPNVEGIIKIWDFIFETQERLIGNDGQWEGRYRPVITPRDVNQSINPNWGGNCGTNHPSISKDYLFNFEKMCSDVGHLWEIYHEEGHAHQYPINMAATTESSNNGYAQMTNYEFGSYNSRNKGIETLVTFKNNGWGWVDILRGGEGTSRTEGFEYYDQSLWLQCHMFFQLYLYFHVQGYDTDFWPRVADKMRSNGGIKLHGNDPNNPTLYYEDYLKFAEVCAEVSETDLYEFFDTWGFFAYYDDVKVGNDFVKGTAFKEKDNPSKGIRFVGDYGSYYLKMPMRGVKADEDRLAKVIAKMKAYEKKAPGIMFIDDHIKAMKVADTCFVASIYPSKVGKEQGYYGVTKGTSGDVGMFWEFDGKTGADNIYYKLSGSNVTIYGSGYVGIKIYDENGRVARIYNKKKFTLDADALKHLNDGSWSMYAPCGDNTQVEVGRDAPVDGINTVLAPMGSADIYDLSGRRVNAPAAGQIYIQNGRRIIW